ncbi:MAG: ribosome small subunit-dependent GTPase A [Nocardioidaceae bacterium]
MQSAAQLTDLTALGWDADWAAQEARLVPGGEPARVTRVDRGLFTVLGRTGPVRVTLGGQALAAVAREPSQAPCTGDWVVLRSWADARTTIETVLPRRTGVTRAEASRRSHGQVLAANVTIFGVVVALDQVPAMTKVERLLALAWDSGAKPVVLLTKADLATDAADVVADVQRCAAEVPVRACSTVTGSGLTELRALLGSRGTLALFGASGAGKSALVNALVGAPVLTTRSIRADGRGRHTSVRRQLVVLPGGGCVIDTPGLRGVGVFDSDGGLTTTFGDVTEAAERCRFGDCQHETEPDCAVLADVESGQLAPRRLESWRKLRREQARMAARRDARALPYRRAPKRR